MTLPALDTTQISWIGYWNFLDHGGTSIDPVEASSAFNIYDEYSNGIQGDVSVGYGTKTNNRTFHARVKDDGWMVAWLDRTENTDTFDKNSTGPEGPYDMIDDWTDWGYLNPNKLSQVISSLHQALSNTAEATFNHGDVGLYNYMRSGATTVTATWSDDDYDDGVSPKITPSDGAELYSCWVYGHNTDGYNNGNWAANQEDITIFNSNWMSIRDAYSKGEITPGETVKYSLPSSGSAAHTRAGVMLTWS